MKSYIPPFQLNRPLEGACIGQVVETKNDKFNTGDYVLSNFGWREYWISGEDSSIMHIDPTIAPLRSYLGIMGLTGFTAYIGLVKIAELNYREDVNTVFVSAAAGAVGSVACQIAKMMGYQVIGTAGSQEKIKWLLEENIADDALNYKEYEESSITSKIREKCPDGIDTYFDNVGGKQLEAAIENMKVYGKIVLCGMISQYNLTTPPLAPSNLFLAIIKRLKLQGFIVRDHYQVLNEFHIIMAKWIKEGKMKSKETIIDGLENAPAAFLGLFKGENIGKMIVKIGPEPGV
jgi:NADPH-dependent curcumin reductase CurA